MVKAPELRELTDEEITVRLAEAKKTLFNLRFQLATGQLDNFAKIGETKKEIARIETVRRERELGLRRQA
ncbi:large subunit ribosomal protein L29 [Candidatus Hakubella thermalkaliphila]|uniref:Large ribosomal subunit protein uL29 n=1 Tax=Candidatus Hakubella thermalkaliphila TaxID=2754717 RepID=A0A6V8P026_9ACTN|nr:large subunit ribosomal protein L29 [Candidatus Hakubella thermalkaliphila]GFP25858.1 large subunit ribosomal protein L29 [Candidatus Hakubella thermalkaliphila]GFP30420.1 large subunit ribosomal protein L29 [Candidatus Hakubella thermalkaliphila]GFP34937.1 large subunit ribosomal protein L29 [Candidatus Hakubella thermalkaliphila]GFP38773.1 large subunit ribosomal protein L29 [Candidatus Hakubella thermalkaliphila]